MKLYYSPASPFARKCVIVAHELGLGERLEVLNETVHPIHRNQKVISANPLGQVPTLLTSEGQSIHDSRVICEYLNALAQGALIPSDHTRWQVLTEQSMLDGLMAAALLCRYEETARPETMRWSDWIQGQMQKVADTLAYFETSIAQRGQHVDVATIALGCALGYLDFRFSNYDWRTSYPELSSWYATFMTRPSMVVSAPV